MFFNKSIVFASVMLVMATNAAPTQSGDDHQPRTRSEMNQRMVLEPGMHPDYHFPPGTVSRVAVANKREAEELLAGDKRYILKPGMEPLRNMPPGTVAKVVAEKRYVLEPGMKPIQHLPPGAVAL